jgi:hypothetical protein
VLRARQAMSVVSEIAGWTGEQPDWISDAVRRAFVNGRLDDGDIADLAALLKAAFGLPDPQGRAPVRLDPATLPTAVVDSPAVSLLGLRAPQNLNAIGHGDGLTFEAEGLTIVYGYNGAGKSGYARALKKASPGLCTLRDAMLPRSLSTLLRVSHFTRAHRNVLVKGRAWFESKMGQHQLWIQPRASPELCSGN